jgi:hypothetical protein
VVGSTFWESAWDIEPGGEIHCLAHCQGRKVELFFSVDNNVPTILKGLLRIQRSIFNVSLNLGIPVRVSSGQYLSSCINIPLPLVCQHFEQRCTSCTGSTQNKKPAYGAPP